MSIFIEHCDYIKMDNWLFRLGFLSWNINVYQKYWTTWDNLGSTVFNLLCLQELLMYVVVFVCTQTIEASKEIKKQIYKCKFKIFKEFD